MPGLWRESGAFGGGDENEHDGGGDGGDSDAVVDMTDGEQKQSAKSGELRLIHLPAT